MVRGFNELLFLRFLGLVRLMPFDWRICIGFANS